MGERRTQAEVSEGIGSLEELRAHARAQGVEPDDTDLEGVRQFLAVFLPALAGLADRLPPGEAAPGPAPLGRA
jgi:hypothetical protein